MQFGAPNAITRNGQLHQTAAKKRAQRERHLPDTQPERIGYLVGSLSWAVKLCKLLNPNLTIQATESDK